MSSTLIHASLFLLTTSLAAQQSCTGLRLYQVLGTGQTGLMDENGTLVHEWTGTLPGLSAHLMPDGSLIRTGRTVQMVATGAQGAIQRVAFDGTLLWDYRFDGPSAVAHHEVEVMPNGNVLLIAWDIKTAADAIARGRDPALITGNDFFPDAIYEVRQTGFTTGEVVWEWHMWDHMVQEFDRSKPNHEDVEDEPRRLDINFPPTVLTDGDWNHFNGIDYDPVEDWIVVSARAQNEIYIIDHSTTSAEAATSRGGQRGRGGAFLFRWGNPQAYKRGNASHQRLFGQHDPRFVPAGYPGAGNLTLFNNNWATTQSAVFEIQLPRGNSAGFRRLSGGRHGPDQPIWTYQDATFHSPLMSSAQRLPNGNTLICSAMQSTIFEVTPAGQVVFGNFVTHQSLGVFQSHFVERTLWADTEELSISQGGRVEFDNLVGSTMDGNLCVLLGSATGTSTGWTEGVVRLPLDLDYLYTTMAASPNSGPFIDTFRRLPSSGHLHSALSVNPGMIPPDLIGQQLHFAHLILDVATLQPVRPSNPVTVTLTQ